MKSKRVLLVEDHPDHAELIGEILRGEGYEFVHCPRGEEALGHARRFPPHLIIMDINLPGMDGMATTRLLRGHKETAEIPVLAVTAYAMPEERNTILAAGCVGIITKPIDIPRFVGAVANLSADAH